MSECRIQAEHIISRNIYAIDNYISQLKRSLKNCQQQSEVALTKAAHIPMDGNIQDWLTALCGQSLHTSHSETFFFEAAYDFKEGLSTSIFHKDNVIVLNENGQSINILPLLTTEKSDKKVWQCQQYCKLPEVDVLNELKSLFEDLLNLSYLNARFFIQNINTCSIQSRNTSKLGNPIVCYIQPLLCASKILKLQILSSHFPFLRKMKHLIYEIRKFDFLVQEIDTALNENNAQKLREIASKADEAAMAFKCNSN